MLNLKKKRYKLLGVKECSIELWKNDLRDDVRVYSHSTRGKRTIEILTHLNIIEVIKFKLNIIAYNLKHRNKLELVRVGARH